MTYIFFLFQFSDVTEDDVQMWAALPDDIRLDPSLSSFRQEYERTHGKNRIDRTVDWSCLDSRPLKLAADENVPYILNNYFIDCGLMNGNSQSNDDQSTAEQSYAHYSHAINSELIELCVINENGTEISIAQNGYNLNSELVTCSVFMSWVNSFPFTDKIIQRNWIQIRWMMSTMMKSMKQKRYVARFSVNSISTLKKYEF